MHEEEEALAAGSSTLPVGASARVAGREESKEREGADGVGNEKKALSFLLPTPTPLTMGRGRSSSIGEGQRYPGKQRLGRRLLAKEPPTHKDGLADHVSKANATELKDILQHEHGDASILSPSVCACRRDGARLNSDAMAWWMYGVGSSLSGWTAFKRTPRAC
ncbi:hypothetical protein ZWY2020_036906 [Hordeum vulgare]|nr:hypothetical protein ZWY2020_036906 [Hordeum vulgare]